MKQNKFIYNQLRFFYHKELIIGEKIKFPSHFIHQIFRVLKKRSGDYIFLFNGDKKEYKVILTHVSKSEIHGIVDEVFEYDGELNTNIHLYQSLVESSRMELIIQKATELGVKNFFPVISEKCKIKSVSSTKKERWNNIILESSEQSFRSEIMVLENLIDFETACLNSKGLKIFCNEFESNYHLNKIDKAYLNQHKVSDISIFIGPVSGYHDTEILFAKQNDFISVSLGSRVLRTETAAIVSVGNIVNQLS